MENVSSVSVCAEDIRQALKEVRPSAMREVALEVPKVYWNDIGGQEKVKERMREAIEWPLTHPEVSYTNLKLMIIIAKNSQTSDICLP